MQKLDIPSTCIINKFIPKKKFFEKVNITTKQKAEFFEKIKRITWLYKLSKDTLNIQRTEKVEEIQIFEITLKYKNIPKTILKLIQQKIPYPILFILKYNDHFCFACFFKEKSNNYLYYSDWDKDIDFSFNALNLETLYLNIISKFTTSITIEDIKKQQTLQDPKQIILADLKRKKILEKIEILKNKIKKQKQFSKKVELNSKILQLKKKLKNIY